MKSWIIYNRTSFGVTKFLIYGGWDLNLITSPNMATGLKKVPKPFFTSLNVQSTRNNQNIVFNTLCTRVLNFHFPCSTSKTFLNCIRVLEFWIQRFSVFSLHLVWYYQIVPLKKVVWTKDVSLYKYYGVLCRVEIVGMLF